MRALFAIFAVACTSSVHVQPGGDTTPPTTDTMQAISGTRIKTQVVTTADGAVVFNGTYDSQLATPCGFTTATDGVLRCLPLNAYVATGVFFADGACTQPVAQAACTETVNYLAEQASNPGCPALATRVYQAGAAVTTFYVRSGTSCVVGTPTAGYTYYAVGTLMPSTMFAAGTLAVQ